MATKVVRLAFCRSILIGVLTLLAGLLALAPVNAATLQSPTGGQVRALVIGIDDYTAQRRLKGAVADANDLAASLRKSGVSGLTVLLDRQATRQGIIAALDRLAAESKPGDLVFVSFAGHGAQMPERTPGSNPNGLDEVFVLSGFETRGPATAERIVDKEINAWLQRLEQKGVFSIFVADTCHGGGLIRQVDERAEEISYRQTTLGRVDADELKPINTPAEAMLDHSSFDRLTFLAAVDKNTKAPEVRIPGAPTLRGALSYAVARAIDGTVPNVLERGVVNRKRLFEYSRQVVSQYSESRQVITVEPVRSAALLDAPVFRLFDVAPPAAAALPPWKDVPVLVRFEGGARPALMLVAPVGTPFAIARPNESAELIWDSRSGDVVTAGGSVIVTGANERDLPGIVDRTRALSAISKLAEARPQTIVLRPNNGLHRSGARVSFEVDDVKGQSVVVLNLTGNGTVQMLFPRVGESAAFPQGTWRLPLIVSEPFGSDTVVAFVSEQPAPALLDALYRLDGKKSATRVVELIELELKRTSKAKIGLVGLFTAQ